MTVLDKLMEEFEPAIIAIFGDLATMDEEYVEISKGDLQAIANKVAFYLDID